MYNIAQFLYDTLTDTPKTEDCIQLIQNGFPVALGAMYVRKHFNENTREAALDMVHAIKDEFGEILKSSSWMDDPSRKVAIEKLKKMQFFVGYPEELIDDKKLVEYYRKLKIDTNQYLDTVLSVNRFNNDKIFERLAITDRNDWTQIMSPTLVNAAYSIFENNIREVFSRVS